MQTTAPDSFLGRRLRIFMALIVSLFLICVVVTPSAGQVLRERYRAAQRRKQIEAFLRETSVAPYRLD